MIEYTVVINKNGTRFWYLGDKIHRDDGPAIERVNGTKHWYKDNQLHRENGPASVYADGSKYWYLHGERVTEADVMGTSCNHKTIEIDGVKYKLVRQ